MKKSSKFKINETLISILPIALIVILLGVTIVPISAYDMTAFIISTILMIVGMEFFTRGSYKSTLPMGENIGGKLSKSRKLFYFVICSILFGFLITLAEPDLLILAKQVVSVNQWVFIGAVASGVGIFMLIAVMRIIFQVKTTTILFISYAIIIVLMFFVPANLLPISFDSGAVTTGPVSVPFLLALGAGISGVRASKSSRDDSFGLIAISSVGPIIITMILFLFVDPNFTVTREIIVQSTNQPFVELFTVFGAKILFNLYEILIIIVPLVFIFFLFNSKQPLPKSRIIKIIIGLFYTYIGLTLFLTGVSVGYFKIAGIMGYQIATNYYWFLIPLSVIFGLVIIFAEPSIHILNRQVENLTNGIISKKTMMITTAIGVSLAMALCVFRAMYEINIYYIIIPCLVVMLVLLLLTPKIFAAIGFDSGGIAVGAMSTAFILPFVTGVCEGVGSSFMLSAFGTLGIVATFPIITIQSLGLIYKIIKNNKTIKERKIRTASVEILEFNVGVVE
ncbi:MAG: DUF1538 domain-containing protein [Clostridia bacterium]|nr:DUF1538 domain-containing protein [Clostridia bacterium]